MNINIFDLSNYKVPHYYERKLSVLKYSLEDFKKSSNKILAKNKVAKEDYPWGKKRDIRNKKKISNLIPEADLYAAPMRLKYSFYCDKVITNNVINYSWYQFLKEINKIRLETQIFGEDVYFNSLLSFPERDLDQKNVSQISEHGYIKNSIFRLKDIFENFNQNKKFPIFIDTLISTNNKISLTSSNSFCEILINKEYFSNSPVDLILGGKGVEEHNSGNISLPKLEDVCKYVIDKLNSDKEYTSNIFIDRIDYEDWVSNKSIFDDKCYSVKNIVFVEEEKNYYDTICKQLNNAKEIYKIILEYKPNHPNLILDDCKILLNQIISLE